MEVTEKCVCVRVRVCVGGGGRGGRFDKIWKKGVQNIGGSS